MMNNLNALQYSLKLSGKFVHEDAMISRLVKSGIFSLGLLSLSLTFSCQGCFASSPKARLISGGDESFLSSSLSFVLLLLLVLLVIWAHFYMGKRNRARLLAGEKKYRLLFENMAEGVFYQAADGAELDVNQSALDILGLDRDQFLGKKTLPPGWKVIGEDGEELPPGEHPSMIALVSGKPVLNVVVGICHPDRKDHVWVNVCAIPQFQGKNKGRDKPDQAFVTLHDVTERVNAVNAKIRSENRLRTLVDTIPDLVWLKDREGIYLFCNHGFEKLFGAPESEIVGKTDYDFVDRELASFFRENDLLAMESGDPRVNEEWLSFATGGYQGLFETIKTPMRDKSGKLVGVLGIARDISERTKAEKERLLLEGRLKQSQKMESIGNLAGGIAHDFNNILSSILGFTELALEDIDKDSPIVESLREVYSSGHRAKELVAQILAFARQSDETTGPVKIGTVVREVLKLIRSSTPTTIEIVQTISSSSYVKGNTTRLHQVIMNLCTNSMHAMLENGGVLEVGVRDVDIGGVPVAEGSLLEQGKYVELTVTDTGYGIAPELFDSIFEPYFTTKGVGEGTGMGLAMVKGIVESCHGEIHVNSNPGFRTVFTVYLPVLDERENKNIEQGSAAFAPGKGRIMFVDDEIQIVSMGARILGRIGYQVTPVTGSVEALGLFLRQPDTFDLVITDMTMPEMTGDLLLKEIRKIRPDIPAILLTGYSSKMDKERAAELNVDAFAYKPFTGREFITTVQKVLDHAADNSEK